MRYPIASEFKKYQEGASRRIFNSESVQRQLFGDGVHSSSYKRGTGLGLGG